MKKDKYADFKALPREHQRENLIDVASFCRDAVPVSFARKVEIYLEGEVNPSTAWNQGFVEGAIAAYGLEALDNPYRPESS